MKKLLVCLCLVLVILLGCAAADEAKTIVGGAKMEDAYDITTTLYCNLLRINEEQYYRLKAPSDGTYVFRILGDEYRGADLYFLDKNGEELQHATYVYDDKWSTTNIRVVKNQVMYLYFKDGRIGDTTSQFTVCFDGYHIPCDIETVTREATCTEAGEITILCELCDEVAEIRSIPAKGHREGVEDVITPATCLSEGLRGTKCTACGEALASMRIPVANHTPGVWQELNPATCTADGIRKQYCAVCNVTLETETVPAFGHSPEAWAVLYQNGCLYAGQRAQKCAICHAVLATEELPALAHAWTDWVIDIEPTKEMEGRMSRFCTHCGEMEFQAIPKEEKVFGIF